MGDIVLKKVSYLKMSDVQCNHKGCNRFIKQNVINRQPHAVKCYKHYEKPTANPRRKSLQF